MAHGQPDFWTAIFANFPTLGEGQIAWFESDTSLVDPEDTEDLINYVVPDSYELHVCSGVVSCGFPRTQRYDLRATPAATWVSPTSFIDADGEWTNEEKAYDDDVATPAQDMLDGSSWSSYLQLLVNAASIDKVKFYAFFSAISIDKIDVDVYYEGAWHDLYEGAFADKEWVEKDVVAGASLISKARIRLYNSSSYPSNCSLYEFKFNTSGATPQGGIFFDTHAIIPYLPQAPFMIEPEATFAVRVYNDEDSAQNMSVALAGFLQKKA